MKNNAPLIIPLSFKNTIEEIEIYNWITSHSGKSNFIKDILKQAREEELTKNT